MKLIQNRGADRAVDLLRPHLKAGQTLAFMTPTFSLNAFAELREALARPFARIADGCWHLSDAPGLGIEPDLPALARYRSRR